VSTSQLEGWVFDPRPLSESQWRSLDKSVHLNRPGKKQISGFGLPPNVALTNINNNKENLRRCIVRFVFQP